jgi:hypothetical protein
MMSILRKMGGNFNNCNCYDKKLNSRVRVGILMFTAELLILWVKSAMSEYCYALIKCRLL